MIKTFKCRLKDRSARKLLALHARSVNQVWNWLVAQHRDTLDRYRAGAKPRRWPGRFDLQKQCKGLGREIGLHQQTVQNVCEQWVRDRPTRFRSSFGAGRARGWVPFQTQSRKVEGNSITYLGRTFRFFGSKRRPLPETAGSGMFVEDALGRWWVCFYVEVANDNASLDGAVGIDLGLKSFATTSDGEVLENLRHTRRYADVLATARRAGNMRRVKAVHAKIANARRDHHHKISTRLCRSYAFIAVGDVNAKRLGKTRMAKSVFDAGWSAFRAMLAYKAAQYVEVGEAFTTVTCSACGARSGPRGQKGLSVRQWQCSACGEDHERDVNSALNILAIARRSVAPPVEESWRIVA